MTDSIPEEDITDRVTPETVETLCQYLYFADQSYDCGTEHNLKKLLEEHGQPPFPSQPPPPFPLPSWSPSTGLNFKIGSGLHV